MRMKFTYPTPTFALPMWRRSFLAAVIGGFATALWRTPEASKRVDTNVVDVMPIFWKFWDVNLHQPISRRVSAFFETVVAVYPDLFRHGLIASGALTDFADVTEVQDRVAKYLRDVEPYIPAMRRITAEIHENFHRYLDDFSNAFLDYAPTTPVYFTVSLFGFSGGMNVSGEATGLYFGIDELARTLQSNANLKIIVEHELFHQYRYQIAPAMSVNRTAWAYMWEEGLATYVSRQMSPGCSVDDALIVPSRLSELAKPHLRKLAQRIIDQLDSTDPNNVSELFSLDRSPPGMPTRSGYYLGFRIAELVGINRSLTQLAHLEGDDLKRSVMSALIELRNTS
jgi:Predicted Zn-dependent protease (DUF2268)